MKRTFGFLAALVLAVCGLTPALAQVGNPPFQVYAEQYNAWSFTSVSANTYTFPGSNCWVSPQTSGVTASFFAFGNSNTSVYFPVYIQDVNPSDSEIVTPSSLSTTPSACGFSASTTYSHTSFRVLSGTAGLQEAVYTNATPGTSSNVAVNVLLDRNYYRLVAALPGSQTVAGIIAALKGAPNVQVVDTTTSPWTVYTWNGSAYFNNGGSTPPTLAFTAGAGTGPAAGTVTGNGSVGTATFTTGTSTATGTTFTLTTAAGGFGHSPTCTVRSNGANVPSGTVSNAVTGSGPYVITVSVATTALTASTFYSFSYSCY